MEHPPYSPDLAPCNFFLIGAIKRAFAGKYFDAIDDVFMGVEAFLGALCRLFVYRFSGMDVAIAAMP
jgi:hypothetical protein